MRTLAILPVKRFDSAKQRLATVIGSGSRSALSQAMFTDVLATLRRVRLVDEVAVVTSDTGAAAAARDDRVIALDDPLSSGQSDAVRVGIRHALAHGFGRVVLVPGDTPLLEPLELERVLAASAADRISVTIVSDRHGEGTNALVISPPDVFEPSFGPGSLARHVGAAEAAGLAHRVERCPSLEHDVDTPDDLAALWTGLDRRRGHAQRTRGALRQLDRARVYGSASIAEVRDRLSAEELDARSS